MFLYANDNKIWVNSKTSLKEKDVIELFDKYERKALEEKKVLFGGRLGMYRYMDMDQVIEEALAMAETELAYEEE